MNKTILIISIPALIIAACGSSDADLAAVDYTTLPGDDWKESTHEEKVGQSTFNYGAWFQLMTSHFDLTVREQSTESEAA